MKEAWEIEAGNPATVTELLRYHGTERGAIRAACKRWRARTVREDVLILRRPGCRPLRIFRTSGEPSARSNA